MRTEEELIAERERINAELRERGRAAKALAKERRRAARALVRWDEKYGPNIMDIADATALRGIIERLDPKEGK